MSKKRWDYKKYYHRVKKIDEITDVEIQDIQELLETNDFTKGGEIDEVSQD